MNILSAGLHRTFSWRVRLAGWVCAILGVPPICGVIKFTPTGLLFHNIQVHNAQGSITKDAVHLERKL